MPSAPIPVLSMKIFDIHLISFPGKIQFFATAFATGKSCHNDR